MTWSRNASWVEVIVRVSVRVSGSLDPGMNTGEVWRDVRHPETGSDRILWVLYENDV